jgi:hypothetical protein
MATIPKIKKTKKKLSEKEKIIREITQSYKEMDDDNEDVLTGIKK